MLRIPRILTCAKDKRQAVLSLNTTRKIILVLFVAALATIPLWLVSERVHSAPTGVSTPQLSPVPTVTVDVPDEVLIGDTFKFKVTFTAGSAVGFGPFVDLVIPRGGTNYNAATGPCDGITFIGAEMIGINGGPLPLTTFPAAAPPCTTNPSPPVCETLSHPFTANGISSILVPPGSQLFTIKLPFGSFEPDQPPITIEVTASLSSFANDHVPLNIVARGGYQFGGDADNNPSSDLPGLSTGGVSDCTTWDASAPVTPVLFTFKVEDPLTNSGPCYDGIDNGSDNLIDSKDPDCKHAKTYIGPEDETATGPNYPRQYKITLDIAAGQTVNNLIVQDCLPNNVVFTGIGSSTAPTPLSAPLAQTGPLNNNCLSFNYPSIVGTSSTNDIVIFVQFYVPQNDANGIAVLDPATCSHATSPNDVKASGNWTPTDLRDPSTPVTNDAATVDHLLTDKRIAIQKSVETYPVPNAPLIPGGVLKYTLNFQVSDFFTVGHIVVNDVLSDGQDLINAPSGPKLIVSDRRGPNPTVVPFSSWSNFLDVPNPLVNCGGVHGGRSLIFQVSTAMQNNAGLFTDPVQQQGILTGGWAFTPTSSTPATGQIEFYVVVRDKFIHSQPTGDQFVDKDDPINNCVTVSADIYTNHATLPVPKSPQLRCSDDSATALSIVTDTLKKSVYAIKRGGSFVCGPSSINGACPLPPAAPEVRPGDQVTFRIEKTIPSGDAEDVIVEDWLPQPIFNVGGTVFQNIPCVGVPSAGNACLGPNHQLHLAPILAAPTFNAITATNSLSFKYVDFSYTANLPRKIDLLFTHTVTSVPFADGLQMTNEARECENNTFGKIFCQAAIAQVTLREPNLRVRKGVIATNNPNGQFSQPGPPPTANLATAQAPPNATLSLAGMSSIVSSSAMVNSNDLATGILDSNLPGGVDANDIVTFAITIENLGGHPAYDAKLEEKLPACFTNLSNIVVKRGTGAVVNPLLYTLVPSTGGTGFTITSIPGAPINAYHPTNGANIIVITFQAKLKADVSPGCCDNVAELQQYASKSGGLNFVTAGFTPPFKDPAQVCVLPRAEKCVVATSEVHTQADNSVSGTPQPPQVTIGEVIRYHLTITLPEGVSPFFKLTDHLPPGLTYMPGTAKVAFVSTLGINSSAAGLSGAQMPDPVNYRLGCLKPNPTILIPSSLVSPSSFTPGDDPTFGLGILTNNDNDSNLEYVVIEFNALVNNVPTNVDTVTLKNNYEIFLGKVVLGQTQVAVATSNDSDVNIVEPNLTMTKTVAANPAVKGQTLTYTVQYTNNGTADAFNVELKDTLPPGLTLGTVAAGCPFTNVPSNTLTVTCAQIPKAPNPGSTVIVTYQAVANPATCPVTLNNQANLTWTSLPGLQGTTVNPTGSSTPGNSGAVDGERDGVTPLLTLNDYVTTASAAVKIDCPCEAMITGLKFNDLNGNGVRDTGEPGLANWTIQVTNSTGNSQTTTTDSAGNYSLTVPAPETYTVSEVLQSGWTQTAPTTGTYSVTVSPGQVVTSRDFGNRKKIQNKCDLQITKEVKPSPLVSGQLATATVTVKNLGTGPCHGPTQVAESMPAGLTLVSATVPGGSCVLSTGVCNYAPAIPAGGSVVFTYVFNVTAQPGTKFENCAKLKNSEDQNSTNNGTCVPLTVSDIKLPDLTIQKKVQCGGPAIPQGTCNVTLTIGNNGPGAFNGILVIQDLVTPPPSPALSLTGSSSGWSCSTGPPNNISCATNGSVSLASGQSTTLSLSVKIPDGQFKNCASVKGYTQFPYNASTLIQESNFNNNESCVSMGGSGSGDCATVPLRLFNTGVADNGSLLASGATDPHYVLLNTSPVSPNAFVLSPSQVVGYVANSATSQWLGPDAPGSNGGQGGYYTYRTTFNLDCDPSTAVISGQWSTDNEAEILLNTQLTGVTTGPSDFVAFKPFVITSGFISGVNTLDFRVRNRLSSLGSRTPTGLHVQMKGTVKCCSATGSLTVTKTVENLSSSPIPAGTSFPITVSCLPSGPNVTLNLAAGGTQTLNNIPVGSKCTVTEGPLPAPITSPVCGSLQWATPIYSPGQSVTIPNSGTSPTVTIQNRLVCQRRPPVDTYTFTRGMNEFCIWGGGGFLNSPRQVDNPNSVTPIGGINSPFVAGDTSVRYGAIGLCYGRILSANDKVALKYTFNATPVAVLSYPDANRDVGFQGPVSETRRNVFGGGLSPIGLQLYFRPQKRIKPFVNTSGGFIFFKDQVPRLNGARFNFTYDFGGGVQVFRDANRAFTLGYKYQRISNGGRALNNPGFNGNVFYLGYSIFNGRKIDQSTYESGPTATPNVFSGGPNPVPLAVHNVGIIPEGSGCPVGSDRIIISMDDEDKKNASSVDGWTGAISHYSTGTHFEFCRVDGNQFGSHPSGDYAVLKLSDTCPDGSVSVYRIFDNENIKNKNWASGSGAIYPNKSEKSDTLLYFCYFPSPRMNMPSFPSLGVPYGVFAAPSPAWLATGTVFTDDEDNGNADETDGSPAPLSVGLRFVNIIYGSDSDTPFRGKNTYLLVAKVSN